MAYQLGSAKVWDGAAWVAAAGGETQYLDVEALIVGGGGSGGFCYNNLGASGGGGAGGYIEDTIAVPLGQAIPIVVGAGGACYAYGGKGTDSCFGLDAIAIGGGSGGAGGGTKGGEPGGSSGGGSSIRDQGTFGSLDVVNLLGRGSQGFKGGTGNGTTNASNLGAGGGGGAGAVGNNGGTAVGGNGGVGLITTLIDSTQAATFGVGEVSGSDVYFAGGGGGATKGGSGGRAGGLGGGADGSTGGGQNDADPYTGGGGGGRSDDVGDGIAGSGGSGIVIFKVPTATSVSFSANVTYSTDTVGSDTIYCVTATSTTDETVTIG